MHKQRGPGAPGRGRTSQGPQAEHDRGVHRLEGSVAGGRCVRLGGWRTSHQSCRRSPGSLSFILRDVGRLEGFFSREWPGLHFVDRVEIIFTTNCEGVRVEAAGGGRVRGTGEAEGGTRAQGRLWQ